MSLPAAMTAPVSWVPGLSHDACAAMRAGKTRTSSTDKS